MPRTVDHSERPAQIVDGLVRLAGRRGLHAVTMRAVAAEAGVSLRLVQYYFQTKAQLVNAALEHLERKSHQRWAERVAKLPDLPPARAFIETFFEEALPTDEESRAFHLVWTSYAMLSLTDPDLVGQPFVEGPDRLEAELERVLLRAEAAGELVEGLDLRIEAARLLALSHGLGASVLVGQKTTEAAIAVVQYHLDRVFTS